jgi:hypothetical protein
MANEPEDLTLHLLREIRAKQDEHSQMLSRQGEVLERLDREVQEMRHSVIYSLGLGTTQSLKNSEQDQRLDEQKKTHGRAVPQAGRAPDRTIDKSGITDGIF